MANECAWPLGSRVWHAAPAQPSGPVGLETREEATLIPGLATFAGSRARGARRRRA